MFSDHLYNIFARLAILVAPALLLVLLIDYGRMLSLRSNMVRAPPGALVRYQKLES